MKKSEPCCFARYCKIMLIGFLSLFFVITLNNFAWAAEKMVQLTVPGCRPCGATKRIDTIMKNIDGIKKYENRGHDLLIITFDDKKTSVKKIINELKKGDFAVKDKPIYLK